MNTKHTPTAAQRRLLREIEVTPLWMGRIDLGLQTGMSGAALESCIAACRRRGWVVGDERTASGAKVVA